MRRGSNASHALAPAILVLGLALCAGCATPSVGAGPQRFDFFAKPAPGDAWSAKIAGWQSRERAGSAPSVRTAAPSVSDRGRVASARGGSGDLREDYERFRRERRRELAEGVALWIQREARSHYIPDGPFDHWATLEETLAHNGDDCDGLELLVYHSLLDLGFDQHAVYRAIVHRPSDGQHHMVTLWFEDPADPWVIDPTGAMATGMPRLSEVVGWEPVKVFSETEEYTARPVAASAPPVASAEAAPAAPRVSVAPASATPLASVAPTPVTPLASVAP